MTVSTTTNEVNHIGNGALTVFTFNYKTFNVSDIEVYLDGTLQSSGFTTVLNANQDTSPGGTVTFSTAPANLVDIALIREMPYTQETDYLPYDAFPAQTHEDALDKLTMLIQQGAGAGSQAVKFPNSDPVLSKYLPDAASRANKAFHFDASGEIVMAVPSTVVDPSIQVISDVSSIASLRALDTTALSFPATKVLVSGYYADGDGGGGLFHWDPVSTEADDNGMVIKATATTTGRWKRTVTHPINPKWWGAKGDYDEGTSTGTDDSTAVQAALDYLAIDSVTNSPAAGSMYWPPGKYLFSSQVTIDTPDYHKRSISAYGVEIYTTGSIPGIRMIGGFRGGLDLYGMKVNHRGNTSATEGFLIDGMWHTHLKDCFVESHGNAATYAALRVQQLDPADTGTGAFTCEIDHFRVGKRQGADIGDIPIAIDVQGACNHLSIKGGSLGNCTIGIKHGYTIGYTYVANSLLINGVSFEAYGTAYQFNGAAGISYAGARFINNRFELGTTIYEILGATIDFSVPMILMNNYYVSNAGTYITKPAAVNVNSFDVSITPGFAGMMDIYQDITARAHSSTDHPFNAIPLGGNRGYNLNDNLGNSVAALAWVSGNKTRLISTTGSTPNLALVGVRGIYGGTGSGTERENLRGSVTFATAAIAAVTFGTNEPDATYHIVVTGDVNETFWVTAKATGGFTINSSNATSTAVVDWVLIG